MAEREPETGEGAGSLARQFGWVSGGRILAAVLQTANLVIVARFAGPQLFGIATIALAVVVVMQAVFNLGLMTYVVRRRAESASTDPRIEAALRLSDYSGALLAVALMIGIAGLGASGVPVVYQLLPLAIWAAADLSTDTWLGVALADGDARINTVSIVTRRVASLTLTIVAMALDVAPLLAFACGMAGPSVVANVAARRGMKARTGGLLSQRLFGTVFAEAKHYWLTSVSTQARNADVLLVGVLAGTFQAAFYGAAAKITGPLRILPTSLATVLMPRVARHGLVGLRQATRSTGLFLGVLTLIYVGGVVAAPALVPLVLGTEYAPAVGAIQVVLIGLVFAAISSLLGAVLQGLGHRRVVSLVATLFTAICLIGVAVGSVKVGALGAAVALAMSFVFQSLALLVALRLSVSPAKAGSRS